MDNQEQLQALSRDEYIRLARESCTRNLSSGGGNKNHGVNKNNMKAEKLRSWDQNDMNNGFSLTNTGLNITSINIKSLLIRLICAFILFLSVFIIDKFNVKVKTFDSKYIQDLVSSDQSIDQAENFFVSLFEQFVKTED
ncbi:MAG: hypothetical protein WCD89_16105 [Anaerocolumna sp.]